MRCSSCKKELDEYTAYEYRGVLSCWECHDKVTKDRDQERQEIIEEESTKTKCFKGLDLSDSTIGKANRELLKPQIEIASKESSRLKKYEGENNE